MSEGPFSLWRLYRSILPYLFASSCCYQKPSGIPWLRCITPIAASSGTWHHLHVCLCSDFPLLIKIPVIGLGPAHCNSIWPHISVITPVDSVYKWGQTQVPELEIQHIFLGIQFNLWDCVIGTDVNNLSCEIFFF